MAKSTSKSKQRSAPAAVKSADVTYEFKAFDERHRRADAHREAHRG